MTNETKVTFNDMVGHVDQQMRYNITSQLVGITPLNAMCTLAACVAAIASMSTSTIPLAHHNIDELTSFAKELVKLIIAEANLDKESVMPEKMTRH